MDLVCQPGVVIEPLGNVLNLAQNFGDVLAVAAAFDIGQALRIAFNQVAELA
ncbi:hypothetical protein D3C75_1306550 [compost metagenome]